MNAAKQKPPPETRPRTINLNRFSNSQVSFEVVIKVLPDNTERQKKGAVTKAIPMSGGEKGLYYEFPAIKLEKRGKDLIVKEIIGPVKVTGTIYIKTAYGPDQSATHTSEYGRGTTKDDEKDGNTSVGFHESCHRNDFIQYLETKAKPTYGGKVGTTKKDFKMAGEKYVKDFERYLDEMEKNSGKHTDEVGYTKSEFDKNGPRK